MTKNEGFERLLAHRLNELDRVGDIESVLQRHPQRQKELRPLLETACATTETLSRVPEPPNQLATGRARVLRAAEARRAWMRPPEPETRERPRFRLRLPHLSLNLEWAWKLAGVALAMMMLLVPLSGQIVWAASESLPHQPLYLLKVTAENQHFEHISDPEVKVVLAMALTDERIQELHVLVNRGQPIPRSVVDRTEQLSSLALSAAAWTPEPLMGDMLNFIIRRTRAQANNMEALKAQTNGHNYTELVKTQRACLRVERVASMALEYPKAFRAAYQAGQPEKMRYTEGGPLGGVITDAVLESVTPTMPATPEETATTTTPEETEETPDIPTKEPTQVPTTSPTPAEPTPTKTPTPSPTDTPAIPTPTEAPEGDETPSEAQTPPGQDVRPDTPPGQEDSPSEPPGQDNRPDNPPDKDNEPPGKNK
ncbi:MAG: hypothetical protein GVY30_13175 [Chloroflexi bacterium]|jgi:hypothetical protein|nr:hypothetical protein [Chloroflexota bacterium]